MSSTTERLRRILSAPAREAERGQVLIIFVGGLIGIIAIAALVFDAGQSLLDRRIQQDASDAAALAGARYLPANPGSYQGPCAPLPSFLPARRACEVAAANGFVHGTDSHTVEVKVPPGPESNFSNLPGYIEVQIGSTRPSLFAGVLGITSQRTGAMGVARNGASGALPYSLLALDPSGCSVSKVTGAPGTIVDVDGDIHVDSSCSSALLVSGQGTITAPSCDIVGQMQVTNSATNNCAVYNPNSQVSGDPLRDLPPPDEPTLLGNFVALDTKAPPSGCPNGAAVTPTIKDNPQTCTFGGGFAGHSYRMFPGYYPGGLQLNAGTFYMEPGIYWIAGGGWSMSGNGANVIAVGAGMTSPGPGSGVLIFNGEDSAFHTQCQANPTFNAGCFGAINWNGSSATINIGPIQTTGYKGMVIYQDRANTQVIFANGSSSSLTISGTIYAASALVKLNGGDTSAISTQIIAYDFQVNGSGAQLTVTYNPDGLFQLEGVGLVQ